jgi:hypothetical protein
MVRVVQADIELGATVVIQADGDLHLGHLGAGRGAGGDDIPLIEGIEDHGADGIAVLAGAVGLEQRRVAGAGGGAGLEGHPREGKEDAQRQGRQRLRAQTSSHRNLLSHVVRLWPL